MTENTFDAYLFQILENKQKFISQIMTSKSPIRVCDDLDEAALSYAEIKALCAGNPEIKEKMDLDIEVAKLKLLKAEHMSQKYSLEDSLLKFYPVATENARQNIVGFTADIAHLEASTIKQTSNEFISPMVIHGVSYTDKETAGKTLLEACQTVTNRESVALGSYRGFDMSLSFDSMMREYQLTLKNEMSHNVKLGTDVFGNITRINNALDSITEKLQTANEKLETLLQQTETAKIEVEKVFPF